MVTTTTTAVVTAVTAAGVASFTLIAVCTLMILLINKEIIHSTNREWAPFLSRAINAAILPLVVVFVASVALKIAEVLW